MQDGCLQKKISFQLFSSWHFLSSFMIANTTSKKPKQILLAQFQRCLKNFCCNNPVVIFCSGSVSSCSFFKVFPPQKLLFVHLCFLKYSSLCKTAVYKQRGKQSMKKVPHKIKVSWKMTNQSKSMILEYSSSKHSRCQQQKSKCQYIQYTSSIEKDFFFFFQNP